MKVNDIVEIINGIAPFDSACSWDNCGLLVGDGEMQVTKIYVTLDADAYALREAQSLGCNTVISHHPVIFSPVRSVTADSMVYKFIRSGISVISVHTPLDMAEGGVNDCLVKLCGLENIQPFFVEGLPLGRVGDSKIKDGRQFADALKMVANSKGIDCIINCPVQKVCVIAGSGGSEAKAASVAGCDTLVTGEAKHDALVLADSLGMNLFILGHFESENIVLDFLYRKLSRFVPCHISSRKTLVERR